MKYEYLKNITSFPSPFSYFCIFLRSFKYDIKNKTQLYLVKIYINRGSLSARTAWKVIWSFQELRYRQGVFSLFNRCLPRPPQLQRLKQHRNRRCNPSARPGRTPAASTSTSTTCRWARSSRKGPRPRWTRWRAHRRPPWTRPAAWPRAWRGRGCRRTRTSSPPSNDNRRRRFYNKNLYIRVDFLSVDRVYISSIQIGLFWLYEWIRAFLYDNDARRASETETGNVRAFEAQRLWTEYVNTFFRQ